MYGTIARLRVKPGRAADLRRMGDEIMRQSPPGIIGELIYQADADADGDEREFWMVVTFESRAAYHANAGRPEQHQDYTAMRELLDADPEWHDGEIVQSYGVFSGSGRGRGSGY